MEHTISPSGPVMAATLLDHIGMAIASAAVSPPLADTNDNRSVRADTLSGFGERIADMLERHPFGVGPIAVDICDMLVAEVRHTLTARSNPETPAV